MLLKLLHWALSTAAILLTAYLVPGVQTTVLGAVLLALVLGIINVTIKPVITIITLPLTILTLGLFSIVVNVALVIIAAAIVPGFVLANLWVAIVFALVLWIINHLFHFGLPK
ncbi:MAG TPA: phage holin family protein [Candidatus Paceibacterota bacterium]|nr:phage holin family protein [Candidatus Paceibacterota bacterium]